MVSDDNNQEEVGILFKDILSNELTTIFPNVYETLSVDQKASILYKLITTFCK